MKVSMYCEWKGGSSLKAWPSLFDGMTDKIVLLSPYNQPVPSSKADPKYSGVPRVNYELPDGTIIAAGLERFQVPEILINPQPAHSLLPADECGVESEWSPDPLPKMVAESIFRCEREQVSLLHYHPSLQTDF